MKKKLIILLAVILVAIAIVTYFVFRNVSQTGNQGLEAGGTLPPIATGTGSSVSVSSSSFPSGNTFQIGTNQGAVTIKNFYNSPDYITQDNETVVLTENNTYTIIYNRDDSGFIIGLLSVTGSDSLQATRAAAEADFLNKLGVSQGDACKLTVDERILDKNSPDDGNLIGLSFCPGSTPSAQ